MNRIDNVRLSIIEYFSSFVVYAKVPMRKIYGSDSVPEKVIKILSITKIFRDLPKTSGFSLGAADHSEQC